MSKLPKTMLLPSTEKIEGMMELPEKLFRKALLDFLKSLVQMVQRTFRLIRENDEAGGYRTKTWRLIEDDNGDLIKQKKVSGVWTDSGWKLKGS